MTTGPEQRLLRCLVLGLVRDGIPEGPRRDMVDRLLLDEIAESVLQPVADAVLSQFAEVIESRGWTDDPDAWPDNPASYTTGCDEESP